MMKNVSFVFLLLFSALGFYSCQDDPTGNPPGPGNTPDRKELLTHWADSLIKPGYQDFNLKLADLKTKTAAFTATPTVANLVEARMAWQNAYLDWQTVELFEFGPAESVSLRNHFNIYPADTTGIQNNIASGNYNLDLATAIPQQGFPALDYLLNGSASTDAAIAARFAASASQRKYLNDLVLKMDQIFGSVYSQWHGPYYETFISSTGTDAGSSFSKVVNAYSLYFERFLRGGKIGIPAGVMTGVPAPEKIEAFYFGGNLPLQLAITAHQTVQQFFNGRTGQPSLKSYLDALNAKDNQTGVLLSTVINQQLNLALQKLQDLAPDLYTAITTRNADAVAAYNEMQKAVRLIKVDMTSALGITITYVDNDGD
jgi:predicted lipoprotein